MLRSVLLLAACLAASSSALIQLDDRTFEHRTQASTGQTSGVWVVLFYASWSEESLALAPRWVQLANELAEERAAVVVASVDLPNNPQLRSRFSDGGVVRGYPAVVLFRDRGLYVYDAAEGGLSLEALRAFALRGHETETRREVQPPIPFWHSLLHPSEEAKAVLRSAPLALVWLGAVVGFAKWLFHAAERAGERRQGGFREQPQATKTRTRKAA